ncbi:hypothetical protein GCM10027589_27810 [Actinocorallia lasiicapitis]
MEEIRGSWFDLTTELAEACRAADAAWMFLRRFAAAWAEPLRPEDGHTPAELDAAAKRLGHPLPEALRRLHGLLGRRDDLTRTTDPLIPPQHLWVEGGVLIFRYEAQHCAYWGIPVASLDEADPPVVCRDHTSGDWWPYAERFSLAAIELVLTETMFSTGSELADNAEFTPSAEAALLERYPPLPLPAFRHWALPGSPPLRWHGDSDTLVRYDGGAWLWVYARTPRAIADARRTLGLSWLMS